MVSASSTPLGPPSAPVSGRFLRRAAGLATVGVALAACGSGGTTGATAGVNYPTQTITIVVPFSAGGPTDTVTRLVAEPMSKSLGQQVIVQNVEGAGGTLGAGEVASAKADGYKLLLHHIGMSTAPALYANLPYKPLEDFKTIGLVTEVPMTIIGKSDLAPNTLSELVAYAKANKATITYANAGVGAASQLCGLLIEKAFGVDLTEVAYKGTGPAMTDLVGGQVDFMCDQTTNTSAQIKPGKVKAFAVTTSERVKSLPDIPTTTESGMPELKVGVWHGLYAPAGTPEAVTKKLTATLLAATTEPGAGKTSATPGSTRSISASSASPRWRSASSRHRTGCACWCPAPPSTSRSSGC